MKKIIKHSEKNNKIRNFYEEIANSKENVMMKVEFKKDGFMTKKVNNATNTNETKNMRRVST